MKQYELIQLNKGLKMTREKDIEQAQNMINAKAAEGWSLLQVMSPNDWGGALYGVFEKEVD